MSLNSTVPLDQLEQVDKIFNTFTGYVNTGHHGNIEKLYQVGKEMRKKQENAEDLRAGISKLESHVQYL